MIDSKLATIEEVARRLRIGPATIRKMILDGRTKAAKVGNRWRIFHKSVDEYLQNGGDENARNHEKGQRTNVASSEGGGGSSGPIADRRTPKAEETKRRLDGDGGATGGGTKAAERQVTAGGSE